MTAQKAAMRKIVAFCHETNSHVHLVAHPAKARPRTKRPASWTWQEAATSPTAPTTSSSSGLPVKRSATKMKSPMLAWNSSRTATARLVTARSTCSFAVRPSSTRRMPIVGALIHRVQRPDTAGIAVLRYIAPRRFGGWRCALPGSPSETAPRLSWACAWCSPLPTTRNHLRTHHA